jgi:hypothetical protein
MEFHMNRRLLFAALLASPLPALAQVHSHAPGPNGGQIGELGSRHVELVTGDGELRLYVLDDQDKVTTARGASGTATIQTQGRQQTLRFEAGPDDAYLVARGDFQAARGMRVVATLTLAGQPQRSVRFAAAP